MGATLKLSEARQLAPPPDGLGAFAAKLRAATEKAVTEDDLAAMLAAVRDKAKAGDLKALDWLVKFLQPPAPPKVVVKKVVVNRGGRREPRRAEAEAADAEGE